MHRTITGRVCRMNISDYKKYEPIFGSWYITKAIGQGSFGTVFEIQRTEF